MKLLKKVQSQTDNVTKYVFSTEENFIVEFSYIDKNDGKDIICVPCQTMCNLGCKFCHTTDFIGKIKVRNLFSYEISIGINYIYIDQELKSKNRTLLISYMGIGEPMTNVDNVIESMRFIRDTIITPVRFAVATCIPEKHIKDFVSFVFLIKEYKLDVKLHFSLHYTDDTVRKQWMPSVLDIASSIATINWYTIMTGMPLEIHYTLIKDVNDSAVDAYELGNLLSNTNCTVKFLQFNEKQNLEAKASEQFKYFIANFEVHDIEYEVYTPPGIDISASCRSFDMEEYVTEKNK